MKAVILAAGRGTRMLPLTHTRQKGMIKIAGKPFLAHLIERLPTSIKEVILVVGYKAHGFMDYFGPKYDGRKISYVEQREQKGTGHAFLQAQALVKETFLGLVGDHLWSRQDFQMALNKHKKFAATVSARKVRDVSKYGLLETKGELVKDLVEKPKSSAAGLVNVSLYVFEPGIFDILKKLRPSPRGEIEVTDAVSLLAREGKVNWVEVKSWTDFSLPWDVLEVNRILLDELKTNIRGKVAKDATVNGKVVIGEGTRVLPGAYIEGPVYIGKNCKIGPNCYVRPYTSVGDDCHVGNATEVKNTVMMDHSNLPHLNYVGDSVIGEECNLAAGTVVANLRHTGNVKMQVRSELVDTGLKKLGTVMGDFTRTGINTSICEGRVLGPYSWTDAGVVVKINVPPGKMLKQDDVLEDILEYKLEYKSKI